jgi:hypothetical protein
VLPLDIELELIVPIGQDAVGAQERITKAIAGDRSEIEAIVDAADRWDALDGPIPRQMRRRAHERSRLTRLLGRADGFLRVFQAQLGEADWHKRVCAVLGNVTVRRAAQPASAGLAVTMPYGSLSQSVRLFLEPVPRVVVLDVNDLGTHVTLARGEDATVVVRYANVELLIRDVLDRLDERALSPLTSWARVVPARLSAPGT